MPLVVLPGLGTNGGEMVPKGAQPRGDGPLVLDEQCAASGRRAAALLSEGRRLAQACHAHIGTAQGQQGPAASPARARCALARRPGHGAPSAGPRARHTAGCGRSCRGGWRPRESEEERRGPAREHRTPSGAREVNLGSAQTCALPLELPAPTRAEPSEVVVWDQARGGTSFRDGETTAAGSFVRRASAGSAIVAPRRGNRRHCGSPPERRMPGSPPQPADGWR